MFGTKLKQYGERIAEQARKEGREEGLEIVALKMLGHGHSVQEIAEITRLSKEQIQRLKR